MTELVWRAGWASSPLAFPPHEVCSWRNRFDDPGHLYRTLYAAYEPITCLRELLEQLRPDTKALADFKSAFDNPTLLIAGEITWKFREEHTLAAAEITVSEGKIVDVEDITVRQRLQYRHASLLHREGMAHLDLGELRGAPRKVTQVFSRSLYEEGAAGILYRSKLDNQPCVALFEDRAFLSAAGDPEPLTKPLSDLLQVCSDYDLVLREQPSQ